MYIFDHSAYLEVIEQFLQENAGTRGYKANMSRAMGCQASYLSQVLVAKVNITPEQALALSEFWDLSELETEYFLKLVDCDRAGTEKLRKRLRLQIEEIKKRNQSLHSRHSVDAESVKKVKPEDAIFYWANWECPAIHEFIKLEGGRRLSEIASRFLLPLDHVERLLGRLQKMGLATQTEDSWFSDGKIEISVDELGLIQSFHRSIRDRANFRLITPDTTFVTFTSLASVSKADMYRISAVLREMMDKAAAMQSESKEKEELVSLCVDFFIV